MSVGYKQQCIEVDDCLAMWSFDGDSFDEATGKPLNGFIIDEVDNQNPGEIIADSLTDICFTVGNPSMVEMELSNQRSGKFATDRKTGKIPEWPKTYVRVPNSATFSFPEFGSFTVEFIIKKVAESAPSDGGIYWSKTSPIMSKGGAFSFWSTWGYSSSSYHFHGSGPLGNVDLPDLTSGYSHVVLGWHVVKAAEYEYLGTQTVWVNGRVHDVKTQTYYDAPPLTSSGSAIEIGGVGAGGVNNMNSSALYLDQISIYGYGLTDLQVCTHFKKMKTYRNMISLSSPRFYYPCEDTTLETGVNEIGNSTSNRLSMYGAVSKYADGPDAIPSSRSVSIAGTGFLMNNKYDIYSGLTSSITMTSAYTIEFWFKSGAEQAATLFSLQGWDSSMAGPWFQLNKSGSNFSSGAIQFTEKIGLSLSYAGGLNDYEWHHVAVTRSGNDVALFVDGIPRGATSGSFVTNGLPSSFLLFGRGPDEFAGPGNLSHLAIYNYALSDAQIAVRSAFTTKYEIKGVVTLQGNPHPATIRCYYNHNGELIGEYEADELTGEYAIALPTNANVDILVFDKYNKTIRYRAYGPVAPSGYEDLPITL